MACKINKEAFLRVGHLLFLFQRYPKDSDKHMLAKQTWVTRSQVSNWFINARVLLWKPMVEEMNLEDLKEKEHNGSEDKTSKSNDDSTSKSSPFQEKNSATENQTRSFNSKQENSSNQNAAAISISKASTSPVGGNIRNTLVSL
ncbi:BEL1-like homeodomain protein 1 [Fagus crenata]